MTSTVSFDDANDLSLEILDLLSHAGKEGPIAICGLIMALGRISSPRLLDAEEEVVFARSVLDFVGMYWAGKGSKES